MYALMMTNLDNHKLTCAMWTVLMLCSKARKQRQKMLRSMNVNEEKDGDDEEDGKDILCLVVRDILSLCCCL